LAEFSECFVFYSRPREYPLPVFSSLSPHTTDLPLVSVPPFFPSLDYYGYMTDPSFHNSSLLISCGWITFLPEGLCSAPSFSPPSIHPCCKDHFLPFLAGAFPLFPTLDRLQRMFFGFSIAKRFAVRFGLFPGAGGVSPCC